MLSAKVVEQMVNDGCVHPKNTSTVSPPSPALGTKHTSTYHDSESTRQMGKEHLSPGERCVTAHPDVARIRWNGGVISYTD